MSKRSVLVAGGILGVAVLWYLFRPELLFVDRSVAETVPSAAASVGGGAAPIRLASGSFHNGAHDTKGTATILEFPGGGRILRLTDFETSNGPDVRVLLIAATDAMDSETVPKSTPIELGELKGNIGDQNYPIPDGVDLAKYRAVTVWCHRFNVNFGTAPLT